MGFAMQKSLRKLAERARKVAVAAEAAADLKPSSMDKLHEAMMAYREAAQGYIAHPSVGDFVRADAARYQGETREAVEKIAELIDQLNSLK